jgi:hypothetical protein
MIGSGGKEKAVMTTLWDEAAKNFLERLSNPEHYPDKALAPYEEFTLGGKIYYFTPGGFLYCRNCGAEAATLVHVYSGDNLRCKPHHSDLRRENGL